MELCADEKARAIYLAIKDVPGAATMVGSRLQELGMELMNGKDRLELTSFSVNGQSFSGDVGITRYELLQVLNLVKWMLDNSAVLGTRTTGRSFR